MAARTSPRSTIERARSAELGRELEAMFEALSSTPMPDEMLRLVDELETRRRRGDLPDRH